MRWKEYLLSFFIYFSLISFAFSILLILAIVTLGGFKAEALCPQNIASCQDDIMLCHASIMFGGIYLTSFIGGLLVFWVVNKAFKNLDFMFGVKMAFAIVLMIFVPFSTLELMVGLQYKTLGLVFLFIARIFTSAIMLSVMFLGGYSIMKLLDKK